ncbi:MAG: glycoside hydrolase family 16 protein [Armatimonadetes bacterium]|nr:glycoside hydrolase family 16 protein [Armatimonadota bacterium]
MSRALMILVIAAASCVRAHSACEVSVTAVAPFGEFGSISGTVSGVVPGDYRIAPLVFFPGSGWYSKPYYDNRRVVSINPDGTWTANVFWVGMDRQATMVEAYLIPASSFPACYPSYVEAAECVPAQLKNAAAACARAVRPSQPRFTWSGFDWIVKANEAVEVGPGPNFFSSNPANVWVDEQDRLHLRITYRDGSWYCSEIALDSRPGYGTYRFCFDSAVHALDPNVIFGLFPWSDSCSDPDHREMDFEFSRWGDPAGLNAQFVIQPYDAPGNTERFSMPSCAESVHTMEWTPGRVKFKSECGDCSDASGRTLVHEWEVADAARVPDSLDERLRINLWLRKGLPPTNGQESEVVLKSFQFVPAETGKPVVGATNRAAADPLIATASDDFIFRLWGHVQSADCEYLTISDGSRAESGGPLSVRVLEPFHCLKPGDYVLAQGVLSLLPGGVPHLDASSGRVSVLLTSGNR